MPAAPPPVATTPAMLSAVVSAATRARPASRVDGWCWYATRLRSPSDRRPPVSPGAVAGAGGFSGHLRRHGERAGGRDPDRVPADRHPQPAGVAVRVLPPVLP